MRKIKLLTLFFATAMFFTGCKQNENVQFDAANGQTLYAFQNSNITVEIKDSTGEGEATIQLNSTTASTSDRTLTLSLDASSNAEETQYQFNTSVTIPAGDYNGYVTVKGLKAGNMELGIAKKLVLNISAASEEGIISTDTFTVNLLLFCDEPTPLADTLFVGNYLIEQTTPYVDGPTLSDGTIVALTKVDGNTREFQTETYPQYCSGSFLALQVKFICDQIVVPAQNTICRCSDITDWFSPAASPTSYDITDDSVFFVTFTDDTQGDCGAPAQTTYKFTKQ